MRKLLILVAVVDIAVIVLLTVHFIENYRKEKEEDEE